MSNPFSRRALLRTLGAGLAAASLPAISSPAEATPDAAAPVATLNNALAGVMKAGKSVPFPERFQSLAPVVEKSFDLVAILRLVVGPRWADIPPELQAKLLDEFRRFTVASYIANFDDDSGEHLEILPETRQIGSDIVVETRIVFRKDDPVRIDYVVRQGEGGWRVVDVLLDGSISRVAVQRSDFRRILEIGGPQALIASLRKKVTALSGGTLT